MHEFTNESKMHLISIVPIIWKVTQQFRPTGAIQNYTVPIKDIKSALKCQLQAVHMSGQWVRKTNITEHIWKNWLSLFLNASPLKTQKKKKKTQVFRDPLVGNTSDFSLLFSIKGSSPPVKRVTWLLPRPAHRAGLQNQDTGRWEFRSCLTSSGTRNRKYLNK